MSRKSVKQEIEEGIEKDLLNEAIDALCDGARGSGVNLTSAECKVLLAKIPVHYSKAEPRWKWIAMKSFFADKKNFKNFIADMEQHHGVSRSEIFSARRRWKKYRAAHESD
jgi:hypothetical protein